MKTTQSAVSALKNFSAQLQSCDRERLKLLNRDLAGFFTSVPQSRLPKSVNKMLERYRSLHPIRYRPNRRVYWSVAVTGQRVVSVRGKLLGRGWVHIPEDLLVPIIEHSFEASVCQVGGRIFAQKRGAFIGFPTSAALCITSVMETEMSFLETLSTKTIQDWAGFRYVDNLLTAHVDTHGVASLPPKLLSEAFYGDPVMLEDEPDLRFLGLLLLSTAKGIEADYIVHGYESIELGIAADLGSQELNRLMLEDRWRYRTPRSAGSFNLLQSGMSSRLHNAARLSFPCTRAQKAVLKLFSVCLVLGFPKKLLSQLLSKHARKYSRVYPKSVVYLLAEAFKVDVPQGLRNIVQDVKLLDST